MNKFMRMAVLEAEAGIKEGHGGPFGAVIVKDGKVLGKGHNRVLVNNDPTCHGEIDAIRNACANIGSYDLKGAEIYTTGEPCLMCLGAILWANIEHIYYGCSLHENSAMGFRDEKFAKDLSISLEKVKEKISQLDYEECLKLFNDQYYAQEENRVIY